jgi:hypothetical protein
MADTTYKRFVRRWQEVVELPPQTVGPLTPVYKWLVRRLKIMPWLAFILVSGLFVVVLYFALGTAITILVSILQRGF